MEILVQDLLSEQAPQIITQEALSRFGYVDILINNAGRSQPIDIFGDDTKWKESMLLEFEVPRRLTELLLPQFIGRKQGVILNVISSYELRSINASAVAKAALVTWSKQLSPAIGQHGIRINCLQPGLIDTENIRRFFTNDQRKEFAQQEIPLKDFGMAEDMAGMAAFLVSPKARYITGTVAVVDGGLNRYPF